MKNKTLNLTLTALFASLTLLLGLTPIGIISIPPANMTIMHIPVIVGTLCLGWKSGMVLGCVFGLSSVYKLFTATSALMAPLLADAPILAVLISLVARIAIPLVVYFVDKCINKKWGIAVASAAGTITNTVLYLGLMLLSYVICGINSDKLLSVIAGVGALNGSLETVAAVLICTPVVIALRKQMR